VALKQRVIQKKIKQPAES